MDEAELIRRCISHDHAAFEALYQLYTQRAIRTAYLVTRSLPEAEDAVQEAFVQVWRRIDSLREAGAFRAWFYRILVNATRRSGKNVVLVPLDLNEHDKPDTVSPAPQERVEYGEELCELRAAISSLPDTHRLPLVLRYYSGLTDAEIAEVVNIPVGTVKSRLYNARQALFRCLTAANDGSNMTSLAESPKKECLRDD